MAKEYIEREAALMGVMRAGCTANTVQVLKDIPAADVIEVMRGEDSVLAEFENDYKDFKKIKTHLAQIIVEGEIEKPYYSILWWDEESKEYNIGYSSYCLDYVRKWLELVFEVVDNLPEADVVEVKHGYWNGTEYDGYADGCPVYDLWECSECGEEVSGDDVPLTHPFCHSCGARMDGERRGNDAES